MNDLKQVEASLLDPEKSESSAQEMRAKIFALENYLVTLPQQDVPLKHHFVTGVYIREGVIPKGTVFTGAIHKSEHLNIISHGDITVWTDEGMERIKGPAVIHSAPGTKRVGYAHEDTLWMNVLHNPTDERKIENLEKLFTTNDYQEFLDFIEEKKLLDQSKTGRGE